METGVKNILAVNGGSSSIKFALYEAGGPLSRQLAGKIDRIGLKETTLTFTNDRTGMQKRLPVPAAGFPGAADFLIGWLEQQQGAAPLAGVGHRIVHGLSHRKPAMIDDALLGELQAISDYDPDHLPGEIELVRLFRGHYPGVPQVACFDTAFHADLPRVATLLPIPRRYAAAGLRRYGFHGLSYSYVLDELIHIAGPVVAGGSVILAHLGNGASLAAVKEGRSIDTTMGFTPTGGIVMGTRSGDLDPGVAWWLLQQEQLTPAAFSRLINHESGLLGVSGTSSDMQDLLAGESSDTAAAEAVALFCYQVKKAIGAYIAALGGLDAIVFTGGIGEKSATIRSRICSGLEYLGISLDQRANENNGLLISAAGSRVGVYAIPTDEELTIARAVSQLI